MRWTIWTIYLVCWTMALEMPDPAKSAALDGGTISAHWYFFVKSLHVGAYALWSVLSAGVPLAGRYRPILMFGLMAHATATELLQLLLQEYSHRGGSLGDVGYDHVGIAIGLALTWKRWTRAEPVSVGVGQ